MKKMLFCTVLATVILCLLSCSTTAVGQKATAPQNLFPDPSFEKTGTVTEITHSGVRAGVFSPAEGKTEEWKICQDTAIPVEPYAVYEAKAFVQRHGGEGVFYALYTYEWDSFAWSFVSNVSVEPTTEWKEVSTRLCVPSTTAHFCPGILTKFSGGTVYIDDVTIVKVQSAADHIAELKAKNELTDEEQGILARWAIENKDFETAKKCFDMAGEIRKADIACQWGLSLKGDPEAQIPFLVDMIRYNGPTQPRGGMRLDEYLREFNLTQLHEVCSRLLKQGGNQNSIRIAIAKLNAAFRSLKTPVPLSVIKPFLDKLQGDMDAFNGELNDDNTKKAVQDLLTHVKNTYEGRVKGLGHRVISFETTKVTPETHAIVISAQATPSELQASNELMTFIEDMCGIGLAVIKDNGPLPQHAILVGNTAVADKYGFAKQLPELGTDGVYYGCKNGNLLLGGNKRGVIFAVYRFLEEYLQCYRFAIDSRAQPVSGEAVIPALDYTYVPQIAYRDITLDVTRQPIIGVRNGYNGMHSQVYAEYGERMRYHGYVHTFYNLVQPKLYAASHPEYFAEIDGKRVTENAQLCLTNPEVRRIATEKVLYWFRNNYLADIVSVSQNDNDNFCTCEACKALAEKEGSMAGPVIDFVNAIARAVAAEFPDKQVDTLADGLTLQPPKSVKPLPNVIVRLKTHGCCVSHPLESCPKNAAFAAALKGWAAICRNIYIWDKLPLVTNVDVMKANFAFFAANHVTGITEDGGAAMPGEAIPVMRSFLLAKLLWNPACDVEEALKVFTNGYYNAGEKDMCDYVKHQQAICANPELHLTSDEFAPCFDAEAKAILDKAVESTKYGPHLLKRVQSCYPQAQ